MMPIRNRIDLVRYVLGISVLATGAAFALTLALSNEEDLEYWLPLLIAPVIAIPAAAIGGMRRLQIYRRNQELTYLLHHDALTGTKSRRYFFEAISGIEDPAGCLILLDVDHFKEVNDTFGHRAGDQVLAGVADVLMRTVPEDAIVARFGGEEFVIFLPSLGLEGAAAIAERLRLAVAREVFEFGGQEIGCTISLGVGRLAGPMSVDTVLHDVDAALYAAKNAGRNQSRAVPSAA